MKKLTCEVVEMNKIGFKAVFVGRHNDHIIDWRGCNFRYRVIKGQPKKGYATAYEAKCFAENLSPNTWANEVHRAHVVQGTHFVDYSENFNQACDVNREIYPKREGI